MTTVDVKNIVSYAAKFLEAANFPEELLDILGPTPEEGEKPKSSYEPLVTPEPVTDEKVNSVLLRFQELQAELMRQLAAESEMNEVELENLIRVKSRGGRPLGIEKSVPELFEWEWQAEKTKR